ncbi:MAG: hypothetical protein U9N07_02600, partial [Euryarchaeota archaeon]|nr:hypothetical protein [Euryarchaeota archaeon]
DDKIELNRQMNATLEQIGQAIFKHWFVDFEFPNEDGKPYRSSGGEMVDSELGEVPEGWGVKTIGDILELAYGKALKESNRRTGTVPVYGSNGDSAVPGLNRNVAYMNCMIVPPSKILDFFDIHLKELYEKIRSNDGESHTLASIRDALLPKLMSGEIRVKHAEKFIEKTI